MTAAPATGPDAHPGTAPAGALATGRVTAVCAAREAIRQLHPPSGEYGDSGIGKVPLSGSVAVGPLGVEGDVIVDTRYHGGHDQAVYAYADADADVWVTELEREIPPGLFGENLRVAGLPVTGAVIGERWQVGEPGTGPLLEVTSPRTPCAKFAARMGEPRWVKRFHAKGLTGTYLRVLAPGTVTAGDPVTVVARPAHGVTIGRWFREQSSADAQALLDAHEAGEVRLQPALRAATGRALQRA
ncbi:MAG: MOSC domain-containing protein [Kineosporiaceae bacterium]